MGLAYAGLLFVQGDALGDYIVVIFLHEPAVDQIERRKRLEAWVGHRKFQPFLSLGEIFFAICHVTQGITRRSLEIRHGQSLHLHELGTRLGIIAADKVGIACLESKLGIILLVQISSFNLGEALRRLVVAAAVEQHQGVLIVDLVGDGRPAPGALVFVEPVFETFALHFDGAKHGITVAHRVSLNFIQQVCRPFVHTVFVQINGLPVDFSTLVRRRINCYGQQHGGQN